MTSDGTLIQTDDQLQQARQRSLHRKPPAQVPGYDVQEFLGSGAYGEVWVGVDHNTGRRVAIKFYSHRGGLDWTLLSREVEKLSFLFSDRYVVQLFDVGLDSDPPYYVMEYIEEGSLEDRLKQSALPIDQAVNLFRDVAVGLVHAHGRGVLHCDLKPANVLLDQDIKPRLADFGQSRMSDDQTPALGTLFYMAPEQADLTAVPDARWDVYALGALLYCMLTGEPPYRDDDLIQRIEQAGTLTERLELYRRGLETAPRPTRHRHVPGIDRALVEIIDRCLAISPGRRFPNVQSVLAALDARAARRSRRPLLILGALGPALSLLVMGAFSWKAFNTAVYNSEQAITERALDGDSFAAKFVADALAANINSRWQALEQAAGDEKLQDLLLEAEECQFSQALADVRQWMDEQQDDGKEVTDLEFRRKTDEAGTENLGRRLQTRLESLRDRFPELDATSWFIDDANGIQVARSPFVKTTVGVDYSHRDYFHGQGDQDFHRDTPIQNVHRSMVFESQATRNRMVAFSVPIRVDDPETGAARIIGVLAMTVELGRFAELRRDNGTRGDLLAVLVDRKPDAKGRRGSVLEHPHLAQLLAANGTKKLPGFYLDSKVLERELAANGHVGRVGDYHDPVGGEYAGRWLAALAPVKISGRSADHDADGRFIPSDELPRLDTGWVVIVQERYQAATAAVDELAVGLRREAMVAFGVIVAIVSALWGFVFIALTDASRSRSKIVAALRRSLGLTDKSLATGSLLDRSPKTRRADTPTNTWQAPDGKPS